MSLVFGGKMGESDSYTIYAGSLDDASAFHPTCAIFATDRPVCAIIPHCLLRGAGSGSNCPSSQHPRPENRGG